jgi:hypothetical protein
VPITSKFLGQQSPCARAHVCTTTTCTHALAAKIAKIDHFSLDSRPGLLFGQLTFDE